MIIVIHQHHIQTLPRRTHGHGDTAGRALVDAKIRLNRLGTSQRARNQETKRDEQLHGLMNPA